MNSDAKKSEKSAVTFSVITDAANSANLDLFKVICKNPLAFNDFNASLDLTHTQDDHPGILNKDGAQTLRDAFRLTDIVAVGVGVPNIGGYEKQWDDILDLWAASEKKPPLIMITSNPFVANNVIAGWADKKPENHALAERIHIYQGSFKQPINAAIDNLSQPIAIVHNPDITAHQSQLRERGA